MLGTASAFNFSLHLNPTCIAVKELGSKQKCLLHTQEFLLGPGQQSLVLCTCFIHWSLSFWSKRKPNKLTQSECVLLHPAATHFFPNLNVYCYIQQLHTSFPIWMCAVTSSSYTLLSQSPWQFLTLRTLMSHICDISPLCGTQCVSSFTKLSKWL